RQQGYNAYHPIGWDSFGLPVENYAIKIGKTPRIAHDEVLVNFKRQLKRLGYSYDWTKEISTADPQYYRWTQWIFNQLFAHGLAYQKQSPQWWCETDQTVLANEQVTDGKCWRCHNQVVKKDLKQWFFKITEYADEILQATNDLDWTESVKTMQKNWIGKSQGAEVEFKVDSKDDILTVFTTRPDTLFGATFVVLAPEHELVKKLLTSETREKVEAYILDAARKSEIERMNETREKTGVFTGGYAINPVNGNKLPIWVADYVLSGYGTGAIMAVPAHDERDFAFAEKFDLPIVKVIEKPEDDSETGLYQGEGKLVNSGRFDGMASSAAREEIVAWLEQEGTGKTKVTYKMRDWLISRQRYWGAPIPIIHCPEHGAVAVPDEQLPVILPDIDDFKPKGGATSALADATDWVNTTCPTCGKPAKRETDTLDGYACSSWYFLRYLDPFNDKQAWDPAIEKHWGPVDYYNGADHAVAHLLYARFWMRFFYKLGLVSHPEPFKRMMYNAYILAPDGTKMSKSRGNTIDPLEIMDSGYGADSLRVYEMFIAPYDLEAPWDTRGVPGTYRFLNRVWTLTQEYIEAGEVTLTDVAQQEILAIAHRTAKKVTMDIEEEKFNTAISSMMEAVNGYYKLKEQYGIGKSEAWTYAIESLLQVLSPFAPHITEELWSQLGHNDTIHIDHWPKWDDKYLQTDEITIVVQVNGKLRAKIMTAKDTSEDEIKKMAQTNENVAKFIGNKKPTKVIYVPGRLVNIVVAN
ncbi:MAG TPA: leucine--tRNA ligase, partial [Candidatus Angelobacter sp.]|nr:leucine--tRNA ligase [Candidatus Angelobacter sp.]